MPGLVGRQREIALLADALTAAAAGRGAMVLVAGEPGIGKTRLLEASQDAAQDRGFLVAWGRAWEISTAPPYWPWIEVLRTLGAPELVPPGETDPFRLYDGVVEFLHAASTRAPLAIVLDDLHAADPSSLRLAELVAPQLRRMRVVVLGSYRDLEARRTHALEVSLGKLARHGETLHLARLDEPSVGTLVRDKLGYEDARATRMIHDASDGNPLFVTELLKLLASSAAPRDVPAGVRAVIRERLSFLSPATVALLQAAAIVGRTFGIAVPAELAGVTPSALEEAVAEAVGAEVVEPVDGARYRFSHALVAETLVADLGPSVRAKLHRRAAEALERHHPDDPAAPFAEIAAHWMQAGSEHANRAFDAALLAARAAERGLAFDDAAAHYDAALAALATVAPNDLRRRAELLIAQGEACVRGGDRARATVPCTQATEVAQALGDGILFSRAALALGADAAVATIDPSMITLLERALALLPPDDAPWRAKVTARLAAARQPMRDPEQPLALAREATQMARRLGDREVLRDVLFSALGAFVDFAPPAERAALNTELLDLLGERDTPRILRTLQRLAFDHIELGDIAAFEHAVERYAAHAATTRQLRYQWVPVLFQAMRAHWEGRLVDAERLSSEAYAIRERMGDDVAVIRALRAQMLDGFAHPDDQTAKLLELISGADRSIFHTMHGWASINAGRLDEAEIDRAALCARPPSAVEPTYHALGAYAAIAWTFRDRELAARHQRCAARHAGRAQMVSSVGFMLTGVIDHGLMRTAIVLEHWDDAARYMRSALDLCTRIGARPLHAQIERDWTAAPAGASVTTSTTVELVCEGDYWTVRGLGQLCRIKDSRGMQMLAQLVGSPGRAFHVLDLMGADVVDAGDAGTVLDPAARDQYMARVRDLQEQLAQATAWNDRARREGIETELDAITEQLTAAYGLGGREKRVGGAPERARSNVRRRIADAMQRIEDASPALGRHFARAVKTGVMCRYDPER